jgi:hypothetical protein
VARRYTDDGERSSHGNGPRPPDQGPPVPENTGADQNRQTALAIQSSEAFVSAISNPWYSAFTVK